MKIETILITGARGFTASYLAKKLYDDGHKVFATTLSNSDNQNFSNFHEVVRCDITDKASLYKALVSVKPDRIIHLAALSFVNHDDPLNYYRVNTLGTENLLSAIQESSVPIKSIILSSSANVYGLPDIKVIDENVMPRPVNHYALSKLNMEFIAKTYMTRLPIIITRPFNYIGFGQSDHFVVPKITKAFANAENEISLGDIHVSRDFTSVYDTVNAYSSLLFSEKCLGETFNICSGKPTSIASIIEMLTKISGHKLKINVDKRFIRKNEIRSLYGSNQKLKQFVDWDVSVTLTEMLREMYDSYSAQI